jgi:hypothetical protein
MKPAAVDRAALTLHVRVPAGNVEGAVLDHLPRLVAAAELGSELGDSETLQSRHRRAKGMRRGGWKRIVTPDGSELGSRMAGS